MGMQLLVLQIQTAAMVILALALRTAIRKLPKGYSYALWILVFARLLCPVALETDFGIAPSLEDGASWMEQILAADGEEAENFGMAAGLGSRAAVTGYEGLIPELPGMGTIPEEDPAMPAGSVPGSGTAGAGFRNAAGQRGDMLGKAAGDEAAAPVQKGIRILLPTLWILGAALILGYNGFALARVKKLLRRAYPAEEPVYICPGLDTPFTLGLIRPRIYLPEGLAAQEREYIICHERVHIRRKDHMIKNLAFLLSAVYWFNPFVWIAFYFLERDMEMSCDEQVIRRMGTDIKKQYSQSLLNFAQRENLAVTPLTFGENSVRQRVKNVLSYRNAKRWSFVLGILILAAAGMALFTSRPGSEAGSVGGNEEATRSAGGTPARTESGPGFDGQQQAGNGDGTSGFIPLVSDQSGEKASENVHRELTDLDHDTPDRALDRWASAFTDRDGEALYELAARKERFMEWDMVNEPEPGVITFGLSSPWPWEYNYSIQRLGDTGAVIRYYMNTSAPEIYIADEMVELVEENGLYYVDHQLLTEYYSIPDKDTFEELYGKAGKYDFGYENTGYTTDFYSMILRHLISGFSPEYYRQYTDPVTAAILLLHLGPGQGKAEYANESAARGDRDVPSQSTPPYVGEGSRATVTYTFEEDGSKVEIPMELIEGSQNIWAPADTGMVRTVYKTMDFRDYTTREGDYIEASQYGIYRFNREGLRCLYPYYVPESIVWAKADGQLYFSDSVSWQEGALDYLEDVICILNLETGEFDRETYLFTEEMQAVLPLRWLSVNGGFMHLYGQDASLAIPLINTGNTALSSGNVWKDKPAAQLNSKEQDAYGAAVRDHILSQPGQLMEISNRTWTENFAYVDLDGDGSRERISLSADPEADPSNYYWPYDAYVLQAGDSMARDWYESLYNIIWAVSLDGKEILLALYGDGPSSDPLTILYAYRQGELQEIGRFDEDIRNCTIENGIISGTTRQDVLQTDWVKAQWRIGESGMLERISRDTYDFITLNDISLLVPLPVHDSPEESSESHMLRPQTVKFLKTDGSFSWIYTEGGDGDGGWFAMQDSLEIKELGKDYMEVFEGLNFAD